MLNYMYVKAKSYSNCKLVFEEKNISHIFASWLPSKLFVPQQFSEDCLDKLMLLPNWLFSSPGQFREVHREKEKLY